MVAIQNSILLEKKIKVYENISIIKKYLVHLKGLFHSVEIQEYFCYLDFTWNQVRNPKNIMISRIAIFVTLSTS